MNNETAAKTENYRFREAAPLPAVRSAAVIPAQDWMHDNRQLAIVRRDIAPGLSDDEFEVFKGVCKVTGFNPILKQIYAIKRNDKNSPTGYKIAYQVGIDGFRLVAQRTGCYAGNDDPEFEMSPNSPLHPVRASVSVYKIVQGVRCPFTASARWSEYYPGDGAPGMMWRKMPHVMLGKCAEALALRKAFPAELSGIYLHEEMQQADVIEAEVVQSSAAPAPSGPIRMPERKAEASAPAPKENQEKPATAASAGGAPTPEELAEINRREAAESGAEIPQEEAPKGKVTQVKISKHYEKEGNTKGRAWKRWAFRGSDNRWYSTFSAGDAAKLIDAEEQGWACWITYDKEDDKGNREIVHKGVRVQ